MKSKCMDEILQIHGMNQNPCILHMLRDMFCLKQPIYTCSVKSDYCFQSKQIHTTHINRGSYMSGHFIWNSWNEPLASFITSIWNDQEFKTLLIIWLKLYNMTVEVELLSAENNIKDGVMAFPTSDQVLCNVWSYHFNDTTLSTE